MRRLISDNGAPASRSAALTHRVRGVAFRVGEGGGVHDDPGGQDGRQAALTRRERHAQPNGEEGDHLARGGRCRVNPVEPARPVVADVVVDRQERRGREQRLVPGEDRPGPRDLATVAQDHQVVGAFGSGSVRTSSTPGRKP